MDPFKDEYGILKIMSAASPVTKTVMSLGVWNDFLNRIDDLKFDVNEWVQSILSDESEDRKSFRAMLKSESI